jgi:hypothetical protein
VRFDEARDDHRIFKAAVDLDRLVGYPALHLVERANAENLAVHHRHGFRRGRAGIERDDTLRRVDGDFLRRRRWRLGGLGNGAVDAVRLTRKFVIVRKHQARRDNERRGKQQLLYNFHELSLEPQPRSPDGRSRLFGPRARQRGEVGKPLAKHSESMRRTICRRQIRR